MHEMDYTKLDADAWYTEIDGRLALSRVSRNFF